MKKKERKLVSWMIGITLVFLFVFIPALSTYAEINNVAHNHSISFVYTFDSPIVNKIEQEEGLYDQVILNDAPNYGNPGAPELPRKNVKICIPPKTEINNIKIIPGEKIVLGSNFYIKPGGSLFPLSEHSFSSQPLRNETIYRSNETYPGQLFSQGSIYWFRGYSILIASLYPVQYIPSSGILYYFPNMEVIIETTYTGSLNNQFRGLSKDAEQMQKNVDNLPEIHQYQTMSRSPSETSSDDDLLIITTDSLANAFNEFVDYHNNNGIRTIVKTLSDIGSDDPDDIRDYIRERYLINHIEYVLIGGDDHIIPAKRLWVDSGAGSSIEMPSDLYYSCLDGTFNYDGDDKWGEPNDGVGGGDVDLMAEVYIGRACVDNENEVANFVDKTLAYLNGYDSYHNSVSMAGEVLYPKTYGGDYMDELIGNSSAHGYYTEGIPIGEDGYNISTLYDRDWSGGGWPKIEIINKINSDIHIINHLGHGSSDHFMKMYESDVHDSLTNEKYVFIYSQACYAGAFDYDNCIGEHITTKTAHGSFASILNTRSGWGVIESTDGPSQRYHRQFWDAIFGEQILEISKTNQDSKEDNLYRINDPCMRWCYYQLHLFGDPTLILYDAAPGPRLQISDVSGGIGVNIEVKNRGGLAAQNVSLNVYIAGGMFGLINKTTQEMIPILDVGDSAKLKTLVFGLGRIEITVIASTPDTNVISKSINGMIFGFLVLIQ